MNIEYDCTQIENYDELRQLQLIQLDILKVIDEFCQNNNIKYSLAYGTLLGAVRHNGYVPWDDDLDICMPRDDYNRFIELWKDTDMYLLQNYKTDRDFHQSFTKIRRKHTAFVQKTDLKKTYSKGIYVDVFPVDRVPDNKLKQKIQLLNIMLFQLYIRTYPPQKNGKFVKFASNWILKTTPRKSYYKHILKLAQKIGKYKDKSFKTFDISVYETMIRHFDNDIFDNIIYVDFEDMKAPIFAKYDKILRQIYGDYMKLPPK